MVKPYLHIIFWTLHTLMAFLVVYIRFPQIDTLDFLISKFLLIASFYFNVSILINFFLKKRSSYMMVIYTAMNFIVYLLYKYIHRFIFLPSVGHLDYFEEFILKEFITQGFFNFFEYLLYAIGFAYLRLNYLKEKNIRLKEKENHQLQLDKEQLTNQKIEADYNFLRTQINPHFLYNTLGFFYGKVAPHDELAAEGLLKLTNIMRYSLHEGDELGRVPLEMEIENLENYLDLQQMRFGKQLQLEYDKNVSNTDEYKILPHLMLTLVENAFKHGNNSKPEHPLTISLQFDDTQLLFTVTNCINTAKPNTASTHTGLANMRNRLAAVYKERQQFTTTVNTPLFTATMQIDLTNGKDKLAQDEITDKETYLNEEPGKATGGFGVAAIL